HGPPGLLVPTPPPAELAMDRQHFCCQSIAGSRFGFTATGGVGPPPLKPGVSHGCQRPNRAQGLAAASRLGFWTVVGDMPREPPRTQGERPHRREQRGPRPGSVFAFHRPPAATRGLLHRTRDGKSTELLTIRRGFDRGTGAHGFCAAFGGHRRRLRPPSLLSSSAAVPSSALGMHRVRPREPDGRKQRRVASRHCLPTAAAPSGPGRRRGRRTVGRARSRGGPGGARAWSGPAPAGT
ncbi:MAG: hypothetical protein JWN29_2496, partial [Acidimicrobiales bacterium]|nr:hypothetical protein [Acidimicrobiales bacterium]